MDESTHDVCCLHLFAGEVLRRTQVWRCNNGRARGAWLLEALVIAFLRRVRDLPCVIKGSTLPRILEGSAFAVTSESFGGRVDSTVLTKKAHDDDAGLSSSSGCRCTCRRRRAMLRGRKLHGSAKASSCRRASSFSKLRSRFELVWHAALSLGVCVGTAWLRHRPVHLYSPWAEPYASEKQETEFRVKLSQFSLGRIGRSSKECTATQLCHKMNKQ